MPILDNSFTCSNGHSFSANAKLRARCPECGVTARRDFKAKVVEPKVEPKIEAKVIEPKPESKVVVKRPILLKQGRPRQMPVKRTVATRPKPKLMGAKSPKVAAGLVKSRKITTRGTMPTVKARPVKTAVARNIKSHGNPRSDRPFWHGVAEKYGI